VTMDAHLDLPALLERVVTLLPPQHRASPPPTTRHGESWGTDSE
jgi:hypothetical protein